MSEPQYVAVKIDGQWYLQDNDGQFIMRADSRHEAEWMAREMTDAGPPDDDQIRHLFLAENEGGDA